MLTKVKTGYDSIGINPFLAEQEDYCEPSCDTGNWECDPDYCIPDAYDVCNPECYEDGACDPSLDDW